MLSIPTDPPSYKEWRDTIFTNSKSKNENKCNEIKNCSLKTKDKLKLLRELKIQIENTILIIENQ